MPACSSLSPTNSWSSFTISANQLSSQFAIVYCARLFSCSGDKLVLLTLQALPCRRTPPPRPTNHLELQNFKKTGGAFALQAVCRGCGADADLAVTHFSPVNHQEFLFHGCRGRFVTCKLQQASLGVTVEKPASRRREQHMGR